MNQRLRQAQQQRMSHPMDKLHYISFIAYVASVSIQMSNYIRNREFREIQKKQAWDDLCLLQPTWNVSNDGLKTTMCGIRGGSG